VTSDKRIFFFTPGSVLRNSLIVFLCCCLSAAVWAMGEGLKERPKTVNGTPVYETPAQQFNHAKQLLDALPSDPSGVKVQTAAFAFYDMRKLHPQDPKYFIASYFYEAKCRYLGNDPQKYTEAYDRFLEKDIKKEFPALQAEGRYLSGNLLQKQQKFQDAINEYDNVEKNFPQETVWILAAKRETSSCYQELGNLPASITTLEDALQKYPVDDYNRAYFNLTIGLTYQKLGNKPQALVALKKVIDMPVGPTTKGPQAVAKAAYQALQ
jgi:tetratricopeptide (TPR) repeat protein